jgi:hypothetical protein
MPKNKKIKINPLEMAQLKKEFVKRKIKVYLFFLRIP